MAYSDYGGYAYRNGLRVEERSDVEFTPAGLRSTPGAWPGWTSANPDPSAIRGFHVVLGDGPIFVCLYKQSYTSLYRGFAEELSPPSFDAYTHAENNRPPIVMEVDGHKIEAHYIVADNHFQFIRLTQPDGNVWTGFSGYGVGAGLEDSENHGGLHPYCLEKIEALFGPHDHGEPS